MLKLFIAPLLLVFTACSSGINYDNFKELSLTTKDKCSFDESKGAAVGSVVLKGETRGASETVKIIMKVENSDGEEIESKTYEKTVERIFAENVIYSIPIDSWDTDYKCWVSFE